MKTNGILSDRSDRTNCAGMADVVFSIAVSPQFRANRAVPCWASLCYLAAMLAERIRMPGMT
jgi:hypothetical protein